MFKEERLVLDIKNRPIKGPNDAAGVLPQAVKIESASDAKLTPIVDDLTDDIIGDKHEAHEKPESVISKIEKKEVISDKLKSPIEYIDSKTGYKVRLDLMEQWMFICPEIP